MSQADAQQMLWGDYSPTIPPPTTRAACPHCGKPETVGVCPASIACPECGSTARQCKRPSGHEKPTWCKARIRAAERLSAANCTGYVPAEGYAVAGCERCGGLPEDHRR